MNERKSYTLTPGDSRALASLELLTNMSADRILRPLFRDWIRQTARRLGTNYRTLAKGPEALRLKEAARAILTAASGRERVSQPGEGTGA